MTLLFFSSPSSLLPAPYPLLYHSNFRGSPHCTTFEIGEPQGRGVFNRGTLLAIRFQEAGWMEHQANRRRWQRYPFEASVRVEMDHASDETVVNGRGVHFSEGGICLFAAANLPVGSQVNVEFKPPNTNEAVRVRGKVRNRSVYLYGVEFLSDKSEDRQQLSRLSAQFHSENFPSA
jgi:PilZ domain